MKNSDMAEYLLFAPSPGSFAYKFKKGYVGEMIQDKENKKKQGDWFILSDEQYTFEGELRLSKNAGDEFRKSVLGENHRQIIEEFAKENGGIEPGRVLILKIIQESTTHNKTENGNL